MDYPCRPLEVTSWTWRMMLFVCFVNMHERKGEGGREERVGVSFLLLYYVFFQSKYFTEVSFWGESFGAGVSFMAVLAITYHPYMGPKTAIKVSL